MICSKIDLYKYFNITRPENANGYLNTYIQEKSAFVEGRIRPAMLVIPGGGYAHVSSREKEQVALQFLSDGYNAFTLEYTVGETVSYPYQLIEGCMAMAYIRENAEIHNTDTNHVGAIGFSAGGHMTAMLATLFNQPVVKDFLGEKANLCRPDAVVLSYPVITSNKFAHRGSLDRISGGDAKLEKFLSLEKRVTKKSSPAFIWSTVQDDAVPCENSFLMASAYRKAKVPFELHILTYGHHGLSIATQETNSPLPYVAKWYSLAKEWLDSLGFKINK
jgi:acetyl esterase/lipase